MEQKKTSMSIDVETVNLIDMLVRHRGGNKSVIVRQAVRELARKEGLLEDLPKVTLRDPYKT